MNGSKVYISRERTDALGDMPELYVRALELKEEGLEDGAIAEKLEIPVEAVGACIRVARLMLARVMNGSDRRGSE